MACAESIWNFFSTSHPRSGQGENCFACKVRHNPVHSAQDRYCRSNTPLVSKDTASPTVFFPVPLFTGLVTRLNSAQMICLAVPFQQPREYRLGTFSKHLFNSLLWQLKKFKNQHFTLLTPAFSLSSSPLLTTVRAISQLLFN